MKPEIYSKMNELFPFLKNTPEDLFITKLIPKGETIFNEGDSCGGVPFVISGTVRVSKIGKNGKEMNIYRVEKGETCVLTVTSVLSGSLYPANAIAEDEVEVIILPFDQFKKYMAASANFQQYVYNLIIERFQEVLTLIDEIIFQRTDERIIRYLLKHTSQNGDFIETTHDKIAIELGTAREVVSRFLKEMEKEGWIQPTRGKVIVTNRSLLQQKIADCD